MIDRTFYMNKLVPALRNHLGRNPSSTRTRLWETVKQHMVSAGVKPIIGEREVFMDAFNRAQNYAAN